MKKKPSALLEDFRIKVGPFRSTEKNGMNGAFEIPSDNVVLRVIVSDQLGWDHVSISLPTRTPTWDEMCKMKNTFFKPEETVIQYHPPNSKYINKHPFVLHLWRNQKEKVSLPPHIMV